MAYQVLARRYRPQTFAEVIGQEHVTRVLAGAIAANRVAHGYLFTGPRGVGKTSTARILAKALNCEQGPTDTPCNQCPACEEITAGRSLDVLEIDGASSGGIDQVRELRENARYAPSGGRKKLYIIDEVHQVTSHGFNALLKTLEEPPEHVVFVLATTEGQKVPDTIVSRVQRFDFRRLTLKDIETQLKAIIKHEGFPVDATAMRVLSQRAQGSLRDAEVLLDQVVAAQLDGKVNREAVERLLGLTGADTYLALSERLAARDARGVLDSLDRILAEGANLGELAQGWIEHLRHLLLLKISPELVSITGLTDDLAARYQEQLASWSSGDVARLLEVALAAAREMRRSEFPRVHMELALVEMAELSSTADLKSLMDRIDALGVETGGGVASGTGGGAGPSPSRSGRGRGSDKTAARGSRSALSGGSAHNAVNPPAAMPTAREPGGECEAPRVAAPETATATAPETATATAPETATAVIPEDEPAVEDASGMPASDGTESEEEPDDAAIAAAPLPEASRVDPRWARVVERVKIRKTYLASLLGEAGEVEFAGGVLRLGFAPDQKFHREKVFESRNQAILIEEVRSEFGQGVRLQPMERRDPSEPRAAPEKAAAPPNQGPLPARLDPALEPKGPCDLEENVR
jgi:DNA polymerase-3 subunit gamma/tau